MIHDVMEEQSSTENPQVMPVGQPETKPVRQAAVLSIDGVRPVASRPAMPQNTPQKTVGIQPETKQASPAPDSVKDELPAELRGWNWGAFLLPLFWSIANNVWVGLLILVPFVNLVMLFVLGAKGSEWAWRARTFENAEEFKKVQAAWAAWGVGIVLGTLLLAVGLMVLSVSLGNATTAP